MISQKFKLDQWPLEYSIKIDEDSIEIVMQNFSRDFLKHIHFHKIPQYKQSELREHYNCLQAQEESKVVFSLKEVKVSNNHELFVKLIKQILQKFKVYRINFHLKDQYIINLIMQKLGNFKNIIFFQKKKKDVANMLIIHSFSSTQKQIINLFNEYSFLIKEQLIFSLEKYFKVEKAYFEKLTKGILYLYEDKLRKTIEENFNAQGYQITIEKMESCDCIQFYGSYGSLRNEENKIQRGTGIKMLVQAFEIEFNKLFRVMDSFFRKLVYNIISVDTIKCWKQGEYEQLLRNKQINKIILNYGDPSIVIVFQANEPIDQIKKGLRTGSYLITGKQYQGYDFSKIKRSQYYFKEMIKSKLYDFQINIQNDYIMMKCEPEAQKFIRKKIYEFFIDTEEQIVQISEISNKCHQYIFKQLYTSKISTNNIKITLQEGKLMRRNWKGNSQIIQNQIVEIYKQMKSQLVLKPSLHYIPDQNNFHTIKVTQNASLQTIQSSLFRIDNKITLSIRSYGSIIKKQSSVIFFVVDGYMGSEFQQILKQNGMIANHFLQKMKKDKPFQISTPKSRLFESIVVFNINSQRRGLRDIFNNSMKILLDDYANKNILKFFIPQNFDKVANVVLPLILLQLKGKIRFQQATIFLSQIVLLISIKNSLSLKQVINYVLNNLYKNGELSIIRQSRLHLEIPDIQKILAYKYIDVKYFDESCTRSLTPISAYLFSHYFKMKIKSPIFIPQLGKMRKQQYIQYLVYLKGFEFYLIKDRHVRKIDRNILTNNDQFKLIYQLIKYYFERLEWIVLYYSAADKSFCKNLYYGQNKEQCYNQLKGLTIQSATKKICENNKAIKYKIVEYNHLQLYMIQTHPSKLELLESEIQFKEGNVVY